ncbi:hypothetical protein [Streptomyces sp. NPDC054961]
MNASPTSAFTRPVRGVTVYSRQSHGGCMPSYGKVELDFEPPAEGAPSTCEFACEARPEPDAELEEALVRGVLRELADPPAGDPAGGRGAPVRARVLVRDLHWHPVDSHPDVFTGLGALAVREALDCLARERDPRSITTRVSPGLRLP